MSTTHIKSYEQWTRKEFEALPELNRADFDYSQEIREFVILPTRKRHDSGYRIMDIVVVVMKDGFSIPIGRFADVTDSIQLGNQCRGTIGEWRMDCLPISGLMRFWCIKGTESRISSPYSTFEILVTKS